MEYALLAGLMKTKGFSQEGLAKEIGRNPTTLNLKLNGKGTFTQREITSICIVLGIECSRVGEYFFCNNTLEKQKYLNNER